MNVFIVRFKKIKKDHNPAAKHGSESLKGNN